MNNQNIQFIMSESFILMLIAEIGSLIVAFLLIKYVLMNNQTKKLIEQSKKLQSKINYYESHISENPEIVQNSLGEIGVDGIIDSLGLPSIIKPFARGLIDSYLKNPEKLKGLANQLGIKLKGDGKEKDENIGLL